MALVKTSALGSKPAGTALKAEEPVPAVDREKIAQRRARDRSRLKQEKAAERIGAATEELAAGITEAAAAAEEFAVRSNRLPPLQKRPLAPPNNPKRP